MTMRAPSERPELQFWTRRVVSEYRLASRCRATKRTKNMNAMKRDIMPSQKMQAATGTNPKNNFRFPNGKSIHRFTPECLANTCIKLNNADGLYIQVDIYFR